MVDEHMIGNTVADKSQRPTTGAGVGEKADFWASKLIPARLHSHFQQRAPGKLNHKATNFFMRNASPAVAMAAHADQARADLECARSDTELLTRNGRFVHFSEIAGRKVAGAYGIADSEGSKIRSGSSVDMIERKAGAGGHDEGASKGGSDLYDLYPATSATTGKDCPYIRGHYESLNFIVFMGYDPDDPAAVDALTRKENGIFNWSDDDLQYISTINFSGIAPTDLKKKQLRMVSYTLELF